MQICLTDSESGKSIKARMVRRKFVTEGGVDGKTIEHIRIRLPRDARQRFGRYPLINMIYDYYATYGNGTGTFFGGAHEIRFLSKRDVFVRTQYQRDV